MLPVSFFIEWMVCYCGLPKVVLTVIMTPCMLSAISVMHLHGVFLMSVLIHVSDLIGGPCMMYMHVHNIYINEEPPLVFLSESMEAIHDPSEGYWL